MAFFPAREGERERKEERGVWREGENIPFEVVDAHFECGGGVEVRGW